MDPLTTPHDNAATSGGDGTKHILSFQAPVSQDLARLQATIRTRMARKIRVTIDGIQQEMTLEDWFHHLNRKWSDAKRRWADAQQAKMEDFRSQYRQPDQWWNHYRSWYETNADTYIGDINKAYDELLAEFPVSEWGDGVTSLEIPEGTRAEETAQRKHTENFSRPTADDTPAYPTPFVWGHLLKPAVNTTDLLAADVQTQRAVLENAIEQIGNEAHSWMAIIPQLEDDAIRKSVDAFYRAWDDCRQAQAALMKGLFNNTVEAVKIFCGRMVSQGKALPEVRDGDEKKRITQEVNAIQDALGKINGESVRPLEWAQIRETAEQLDAVKRTLTSHQQEVIEKGRVLAGSAVNCLNAGLNQKKFPWLNGYIQQLELKLQSFDKKMKDYFLMS